MYEINITHELTRNNIAVILGNKGVPLCIAGKGSYTGESACHAFLYDDDAVILFYIGRYTAVGGKVEIYTDSDHDYRSVYVGCILQYGIEGVMNPRINHGQGTNYLVRKGMVVIGDDVWIGDGVTIMASVVIGTGAVIAARSVVTKDIPPYTIWAGNPARQVGTRFPQDIAEKLLKISWWEFDSEKLALIEQDMRGDVVDFVEKYYEGSRKRYDEYISKKIYEPGVKEKFVAFIDVETEFPTFCDIVESFYATFRNTDKKLYLYYHKDVEKEQNVADSVATLLEELKNGCKIEMIGIMMANDEQVIAESDYFILGRDTANIYRLGYAMKYGVRIISGVDKPMFRNL